MLHERRHSLRAFSSRWRAFWHIPSNVPLAQEVAMPQRRFLVIPLLLLMVAAGQARAGESLASRSIVGQVAVGYAAPLGSANGFFDAGWSASAGATFHFSPTVPVGMRLDLGYARSQATEQALAAPPLAAPVRVVDGHVAVTHLMLDGLWEFGGRGHIGGWLGGGVGILNRRIEVTNSFAGSPPCNDPVDPGSCLVSPGGRDETNDQLTQIAFDVSAAARFPLPSGSEIYLEARYQRMESDPTTEFIPVVVGFRW
ncbi:MAG TPA: hypothetical protein VFQ07_10385 [Candidatus Polarisedimenticolia bacterium]|nr:hypothetical protein [Candidatus Polarisedimenticolia bacterium]